MYICCMQETRWRGHSTRLISCKNSVYKLFWIGKTIGTGGVGIFLAERWVENVVNMNRVNDRIIVVKILVGKIVICVVSAYATQRSLSDSEKDEFYDELVKVTFTFSDNELVVLGGDLNGHVGKTPDGYEGAHDGNGFGLHNKEGERILEFLYRTN